MSEMRGLVYRPAMPRTLLRVAMSAGKPANEAQCTVALIKNVVGTGVLSLPVGVSRLSDGGAASSEVLLPAAVMLLAFG